MFQVRAAPPPPKQHPRGQVKRREEVEITLVWRQHPGGGDEESVETSWDLAALCLETRSQRKLEETLHPEDAWRPGEARHFVLMSFHTTPQKVCVLWRNYVPFSELHPFNFLSCSVDSFLNLPYAVFVSYLTKPCFFYLYIYIVHTF